jgi:hypothetical protein
MSLVELKEQMLGSLYPQIVQNDIDEIDNELCRRRAAEKQGPPAEIE